jgi:hypothetical protein
MVTSSAPSRFDCTATSTAVLLPPIATTRRPTGSVEICRLAQALDISDRILDASQILARDTQRFGGGEPNAEKHGVVLLAQSTQCDIAAERMISPHSIPPIARMKSTPRCALVQVLRRRCRIRSGRRVLSLLRTR